MGEEFIPWVEKYRSKKLKDVVGQKDIVERLESFAKTKNMPNLLLVGRQGTGKTLSVLALAHELYGENIGECLLALNASDERGIDVVRGKIKDFARTLPISDVPFKVIYLDEADAMTDDAQQALRRTMESYAKNTRFILSCNFSSRIIEPIQSRCAVFRFKPLADEEVKKIVHRVVEGEGLKVDEKGLEALVYVAEGDARKAINVLQGASALGKKIGEEDVYKIASRARPKEVAEMIEKALAGSFAEARKLLDELMIKYGMSGEDIIKQIYRETTQLTSLNDKQKVALVEKVGEYDFRMSQGADERIQLEALLAQMMLLGKE